VAIPCLGLGRCHGGMGGLAAFPCLNVGRCHGGGVFGMAGADNMGGYSNLRRYIRVYISIFETTVSKIEFR